ncbi:MAG: hypothetical protein ACLROI_02985 [Beduini sp.]|uniref:hypothetical protein n=1 Tax=Beduini sp. TaxID=1922300 RepID=UPI0011CBB932
MAGMLDRKHKDEPVRYIKIVNIGSVNPNHLLSETSKQKQVELLNRCLNDFPHGKIIGKDVTVGVYKLGDHQFTMEMTAYHIGFHRKPQWLDDGY